MRLVLATFVAASMCTGCFSTLGTILGAATTDYRATDARKRDGGPDPAQLEGGEYVVIQTKGPSVEGTYIDAVPAPPHRVELVVYARDDDGTSTVERRIPLEDVTSIAVWKRGSLWAAGLVAGLVADVFVLAMAWPEIHAHYR
jgi:hypothetical protein